jgi:hypothetical protein
LTEKPTYIKPEEEEATKTDEDKKFDGKIKQKFFRKFKGKFGHF